MHTTSSPIAAFVAAFLAERVGRLGTQPAAIRRANEITHQQAVAKAIRAQQPAGGKP